MRKLLLIILLMLPIVYGALDECQGVEEPSDIPCAIISTWSGSDGACSGEIKVYNATPTNIINLSWSSYATVCNATFNISDIGTYYYNSSIEDGIVVVEGTKVWLVAILLIP